MKDIFFELIKEAKDGQVIIDNEVWPIGFNTFIYRNEYLCEELVKDDKLSALVIKNEEKFFEFLQKYINLELQLGRRSPNFYGRYKERNLIKLLMAYSFVNATTEDFVKPIDMLQRNIDFLNDKTFDYLYGGIEFRLGELFGDSKIRIKKSKQSILMETPSKMEISIVKDSDDNSYLEYRLPTISYGIRTNESGEKECYIYSLLNSKKEDSLSIEEEKYRKKIARLLYKVNAGVEKEENDSESILDVSPSAVISLLLFCSLLKREGITKIIGVPYLPLRYLARDLVAQDIDDADKRNNLFQRNDNIQWNVTNKFIRTFKRVAYHLKDAEIDSYPYDLDAFLHMSISRNRMDVDNELLNEVSKSVIERKL